MSEVLLMYAAVWAILDSFCATEAQSLTCTEVPRTSPCRSGLEKQRPNYYLPQILPNGLSITDGFIALAQTNSGGLNFTSDCAQLLKGFLCSALYAPCNNQTGQPLEMCSASCQLLRSTVDGFQCQNVLNALLAVSSTPDRLKNVVDNINCSSPTTYFFGDASLGFSNTTCYNLIDMMTNSTSDTATTTGHDVEIVKIAAPVLGSAFVLVSLLTALYFITRLLSRRKNIRLRYDLTKHSDNSVRMQEPIIRLTDNEIHQYKGLFKDSLITYGQLQRDKDPVGEGAFGKVYKGLLTQPGCSVKHVAIKTIKNISSSNDINNFFMESVLMTQFHHQNILGLFGVCFDSPDGTPLMVLPFMINGNLKSHLIKSRSPLSEKPDIFPDGLGLAVMTRMCTDIARGMSYLADQRFVHRDLAARNCLLDHDLSVKIGDFGLSRDVYLTDYYKASSRTALQVKWMPPEMLRDGISNEKTDVWAYGVTCWEVFSLGSTPYPGVDNHLVLEHLMKGFRLAKPVLCPEEIYELLQSCWCNSPDDRPSFSQMLTEKNAVLVDHSVNVSS